MAKQIIHLGGRPRKRVFEDGLGQVIHKFIQDMLKKEMEKEERNKEK